MKLVDIKKYIEIHGQQNIKKQCYIIQYSLFSCLWRNRSWPWHYDRATFSCAILYTMFWES